MGYATRFRHELKFEVDYGQYLCIRQRLRAVCDPDPHTRSDGRYLIRSIYFDNIDDKALGEKIVGASTREKFRIRYYNDDLGYITLEKKQKINNMCKKVECSLTSDETLDIISGETGFMKDHPSELVRELYTEMMTQNLRPKVLVSYTREPYIYRPGNVRVTFDYNIRTGLRRTDFLDPDCLTVPAGNAPILLEVKWDSFLPSVIRDAVQTPGRRVTAFSKYAQCRIYG